MTAVFDVDTLEVADGRLGILVLHGAVGEGVEHVESGGEAGVVLDDGDVVGKTNYQFVVESHLDFENLLLGGQYLGFQFFEFLSDISFAASKGLLAGPLRRHLRLVGVRHLKVIAEDVVEADFQRVDAGFLGFALLDVGEDAATVGSQVGEFVEFGVDATLEDAALARHHRRVFANLLFDALAYVHAGVELVGHLLQNRGLSFLAEGFQLFGGAQGGGQLQRLARVDLARGDFRDHTFQIAHLFENVG